MAQATRHSRLLHGGLGILACAALVWSITSSLYRYPHSLSYFNELAGGPEHGHEHLLDSSIAWGQDLLYLKDWYDAHPEARPFHVITLGVVPPRIAGIASEALQTQGTDASTGEASVQRVRAGWYAVDITFLQMAASSGPGIQRTADGTGWDQRDLVQFTRERPIERVGYCYWIFQVGEAPKRTCGNDNERAAGNAAPVPVEER